MWYRAFVHAVFAFHRFLKLFIFPHNLCFVWTKSQGRNCPADWVLSQVRFSFRKVSVSEKSFLVKIAFRRSSCLFPLSFNVDAVFLKSLGAFTTRSYLPWIKIDLRDVIGTTGPKVLSFFLKPFNFMIFCLCASSKRPAGHICFPCPFLKKSALFFCHYR